MRQPLPKKEITLTEAQEAARFLGLSEDVDRLELEAVKEAYRKKLMSTHPDVNPDMAATDAAVVLVRAKIARHKLEVWIALRPKTDCPVCSGTGRIRVGSFTTEPCPSCSK